MQGRPMSVATMLWLVMLLLGASRDGQANEGWGSSEVDLRAAYEGLEAGMTTERVAELLGRTTLLTAPERITSWLMWTPPAAGRPVTVLRASFRDGRLARVEYESFGGEYQRLVKGGDSRADFSEDEVRRLWRQVRRATQAAEQCEDALEAVHQLVLRVQERLTPSEQAAWVRALELRRAVEADLGALGR